MERARTLVTDVKDLGELLNGASVDQAQLVPVGRGIQLVVDLTRAMVERQTVVRQGLFRRLRTPWTKCQLTLNGISAVTVKRLTEMSPDQAPLLSCEAVQGGYAFTLQATDGLQFILHLEQLDGIFKDLGSPIEAP